MASFEFLAVILTGIGLTVSILYYTTVLQNANKTRELQLRAQEQALESRNTQFFIQLYHLQTKEGLELVWSEKTWDTFEEWWEQSGPTKNPEAFSKWFMTMLNYEMYGDLVKNGFLDINILDDLMSGGVLLTWDRFEPIIVGLRERYGYPHLQEHQEYLVNEIRKIVERQHPDYTGQYTP